MTIVRLARESLCAVVVFIAASTGFGAPPNVVLILADDQRWDMLGAAGNERAHTPNLDRLASEGLFFTQASCHIPQCAPERAMFLTGLTAAQSGYLSIDAQSSGADADNAFEHQDTLPSLLRDAGYRTVLVGKWHLKPRPRLCGFTDVRLWFDGGQTPYDDPPLRRGEGAPADTPGNITELFADDALAFLSSPEAREAPFFLWLCFTAPHEPCGPTPDRIARLYDGLCDEDLMPSDMPRPASGRFKGVWPDAYRAVAHLDEQVGRVVAAIDAAGLRDSTLLVYTSDSGIMMGRRGIDSKVCPYEDSVRIPLIVRAPMFGAAPRRDDAPISNLDLPKTIVSLAGLEPPARWPGRDLAGFLATGADAPPWSVIAWAEGTRPPWKKFSNRTIRSRDWKLIVWEDPGHDDELYDIRADAEETLNRAGEPDAGTRLDALKRSLKAWLDSAGDPASNWPGKWP